MTRSSTLVIANNYELRAGPSGGPYSAESVTSADFSVLWSGDNKIVVTPEPLQDELLVDVAGVLGWSNVSNYVPQHADGYITDALAHEIAAGSMRLELERSVTIDARGLSAGLLRLDAALRKAGNETNNVFAAPSTALVAGADSKTGSRLLLEAAGVPIARGYTADNVRSARAAIQHVTSQFGGFVLKTDQGSGGRGVAASAAAAEGLLRDRFAPFVVEEPIGLHVGRRDYAYNGLVTGSGVSSRAVGIQLVNGVQYSGGLIGVGAVPAHLERRIQELGEAVGARLHQDGYRGWYNVDFMRAVGSQRIYAAEINARRSGSSALIDVLTALPEVSARPSAACLVEHAALAPRITNYVDGKVALKELWFRPGKTCGAFIACASSIASARSAGVVTLGRDACEARQVMDAALQRLRGKPNA